MGNEISKVHREKIARYFIAIIPPMPLCDEVLQLKKFVSERYNCKAALNSPPHITLHMPFEWKREKESALCSELKSFFEKVKDFDLELLNFSCFAPRTIFVTVSKTRDLENLEKELHRFCKKKLNLFNARYKDLPFHPHLTIAFRDLSKASFADAWNEFKDKEFTATFRVAKIALLKHSGKLWEPLHYFLLN